MKIKYFIAVDIGGTKIAGAVVNRKGRILYHKKISTPQKTNQERILSVIINLIKQMLLENELNSNELYGIGLGIPGIVNSKTNKIITTPNLKLAGAPLVLRLQKTFKTKIVIGNDVNLGILGEQWLGAAKGNKNVVGIFPGTGIGGGIIVNGALLLGHNNAAAEIGHMIIERNGPKCNCGNRGCLETLSSRRAIEKEIKNAVKKKKKTIITKLNKGNLSVIKSNVLREALKRKDKLVTKIIRRASLNLAFACLNLRHLFDPQLIVLGGGLIEACADFMLPTIKRTVISNPFFSRFKDFDIVEAKLGDYAVLLGAVVVLRQELKLK